MEEMESEDEVCEECKRSCQLIHGKRVSSFFKVMLGKGFSNIMFFPPRFARLVSHLTNREAYLEDSSRKRWMVTVGNHNGALAILKGWHKFSSDHGLSVGNLVVFHYVQREHFVVQIYGTSGCQQMFYPDISQGRKRESTYLEATSHDELLQITDINSVNKKRKSDAASEPEKVADKPQATNIDDSIGKGQPVHPAANLDDSFCMVDRDAQYDQGDDRMCLDLSNFETPTSKPLTEGDNGNCNHVGTNLRSQADPTLVDVEIDNLDSEEPLPMFEVGITGTDIVSRPAVDIPPLPQEDEIGRTTCNISSPFLKPAGNCRKSDGLSNGAEYQNPQLSTSETGNHKVSQSYNREAQCTGSSQIAREKSTEASHFQRRPVKEEFVATATKAYYPRLVKKEFAATATEADCPAGALSEVPASGFKRVIKSEPVDSEDTPSIGAVSYSCLQKVDGQDFLVLPESWRKHLKKRAKMGRWIIFLQGPDKRTWPTFYHSKSGVEVLRRGWRKFKAAYGLNPGDECLFQLVSQLDRTFDVLKVQSKMPEELLGTYHL